MNATTATASDLITATPDTAPLLVVEDFDQWTGPVDATVRACGYCHADLAA